jgi:hypothetical protein
MFYESEAHPHFVLLFQMIALHPKHYKIIVSILETPSNKKSPIKYNINKYICDNNGGCF